MAAKSVSLAFALALALSQRLYRDLLPPGAFSEPQFGQDPRNGLGGDIRGPSCLTP